MPVFNGYKYLNEDYNLTLFVSSINLAKYNRAMTRANHIFYHDCSCKKLKLKKDKTFCLHGYFSNDVDCNLNTLLVVYQWHWTKKDKIFKDQDIDVKHSYTLG